MADLDMLDMACMFSVFLLGTVTGGILVKWGFSLGSRTVIRAQSGREMDSDKDQVDLDEFTE